MTQPYKLKLTGPGVSLDQEVPADIAQQIIVAVFGSAPAVPTTGGASSTGAPASRHGATVKHETESLAEFLRESGAKRMPDKITAIAHYLKTRQNKRSFTRGDLEAAFEEAAESLPRNLLRDIKWVVGVGWIAPKKDETGAYYVTGSGSSAVTNKFPQEVVKKARLPTRKRKRSKKPTPGHS